MAEKSQKEKCKEWTHITGIIYNVLKTVKDQIGGDKNINKSFDSIMIGIRSINHEFVEAYNNGGYEDLEFPAYDIDSILKYTQGIADVVLDINSSLTNDIVLGNSFDLKKFIMDLIDTFVPALEVIADHLNISGNKDKYGVLYTALNGLMQSFSEIKNIIAK